MRSQPLLLFAAMLLLFAVSFLAGAEAYSADLRDKGYYAPHLWQRLEPKQNPCKETQP